MEVEDFGEVGQPREDALQSRVLRLHAPLHGRHVLRKQRKQHRVWMGGFKVSDVATILARNRISNNRKTGCLKESSRRAEPRVQLDCNLSKTWKKRSLPKGKSYVISS